MKIGFSSNCCPAWDLRTMLEQAALLEFNGIELCGLQGELHLPSHPELSQNADAVVQALQCSSVELGCLGTSVSLGDGDRQETDEHKALVREYIELAAKLRCPYVRLSTGDVPPSSNHPQTLQRIAEELADLAHFANRQQVTILIENSGDLSGSRDLWFVLDSVSHPSLQACWNPINSSRVRDRPTRAVPNLRSKLGMVHLADATVDGSVVQSYRRLGEGDVELGHLIELLCGVCFEGYLMVDWPKLRNDSLEEPDEFLPHAAKFLKARLTVERQPLTAYKGDKNAPEFAGRHERQPTRLS